MLVHNKVSGGDYQLVEEDKELTLSHNIDQLSAGQYICDIYKVSYTNNHPYPYGYDLIAGWCRSSSSTPYTIYQTINSTDYIFPDEHIELDELTINSAIMSGYVYHVLSEVGVGTVDIWLPSDSESQQNFAYSLYFSESETIDIPEMNFNEFELYPNPAKNIINIDWKGEQVPSYILIYDGLGRCVMNVPFKSSLDINDIDPGVYIMKLVSDHILGTNTFVK